MRKLITWFNVIAIVGIALAVFFSVVPTPFPMGIVIIILCGIVTAIGVFTFADWLEEKAL